MAELIAFCGLNCGECMAYKATLANDQTWQEQILEDWRKEYNNPEMTLDAVTCDGCTGSGRHGGYCAACPVRKCALEHGVDNCAACPEYACAELTNFFALAPAARENLEILRAGK
jgi:hypothetical protein